MLQLDSTWANAHTQHAQTEQQTSQYFVQVLWDLGILDAVFVCVFLYVFALSCGCHWSFSLIKENDYYYVVVMEIT